MDYFGHTLVESSRGATTDDLNSSSALLQLSAILVDDSPGISQFCAATGFLVNQQSGVKNKVLQTKTLKVLYRLLNGVFLLCFSGSQKI